MAMIALIILCIMHYSEGITIMGLVSYSTYFITHDILATSSWGSLGLMVGALYATARVGMAADNEVNDGIKAGGSPLTVIPYYLVLCSIAAVKAIKHAVTEPYSSARKELEQKSLEENKRIEVSNNRIEEPKIIGTEQQAEQEAATEEEFTIKETNSTTIIS